MPKHATKTSFGKGVSGNPAGRKKQTPEYFEFKAAIAALLPTAVERVSEMLDATHKDGTADMQTRERAIHIVFDRNIGKLAQVTEITGKDGAAIQIEDNTPSIKILLAAALPQPTTPTIEGKADGE